MIHKEPNPIGDRIVEANGYTSGQQDYENDTTTKNPFPNTPEGDIWERGYRQGKRHAKQGII